MITAQRQGAAGWGGGRTHDEKAIGTMLNEFRSCHIHSLPKSTCQELQGVCKGRKQTLSQHEAYMTSLSVSGATSSHFPFRVPQPVIDLLPDVIRTTGKGLSQNQLKMPGSHEVSTSIWGAIGNWCIQWEEGSVFSGNVGPERQFILQMVLYYSTHDPAHTDNNGING